MDPFEYFEPTTVGEVTQLLFDLGKRAKILAGGVDLLPRMRKRDIQAEYVINIQKIPNLDFIDPEGEQGLRFGAATRLRSLEISKAIQSQYPTLYEAIHQITSVQAKCMGTVVGNLCVATPASDVATTLFTLGAQLKITSPQGARAEPIGSFYLDHFETSLKRGEMVTEVFLPDPSPETRTAFLNLVRTHSDIAKVSAAVAITIREGICEKACIAIGAAAPTVIRAGNAEALLIGQRITPQLINEAAKTAAKATRPITDLRSTAEYRREMAGVLVRRVLEKVFARTEC